MHTLTYQQPATFWEEALPLGNGRIGAMVFGGTTQERVQLNEDTLWSGRPSSENGYGMHEHLDDVRQLLREGRYSEATQRTDTMVGPHDSQCYQMAGDLFLDFGDVGETTHYRRGLDLASAIATCAFESDGTTYARESFVSAPHQVFAMRVSADQAGKINCALSMDSQMRFDVRAEGRSFVLTGQLPFANRARAKQDPIWEQDDQGGIRYVVKGRVVTSGGSKISIQCHQQKRPPAKPQQQQHGQ